MSTVLAPAEHPAIGPQRDDVVLDLEAITRPCPITVIESFNVAPNAIEAWTELWEALAPFATESRGCHKFELLHDRRDPTRYSLLTEWEDMDSYNRFRRETRVLWTEQLMASGFRRTRFSTFDIMWDDRSHPNLENVTADPLG